MAQEIDSEEIARLEREIERLKAENESLRHKQFLIHDRDSIFSVWLDEELKIG